MAEEPHLCASLAQRGRSLLGGGLDARDLFLELLDRCAHLLLARRRLGAARRLGLLKARQLLPRRLHLRAKVRVLRLELGQRRLRSAALRA